MSVLYSITTSALHSARDIMFLNSGQTLVVVSVYNASLLFVNRSGVESYNYDFVGSQNVSCSRPHVLTHVNDKFFYLVSWNDDAVYSFLNYGSTPSWAKTFLFNSLPIPGVCNGDHITTDESHRLWKSLGIYGARVFSEQGAMLGILNLLTSDIFDILILHNYVMFVSGYGSNRISRIDPNFEYCSEK